jgi:hypothetical protein
MNNKSINFRFTSFLNTLIVALAACFYSCEKEATNIKLPSAIPKLVVGCYISPQDSIVTLTLTRSKPVFGSTSPSGYKPVTDASVIISNSTQSVTLSYNDLTEKYEVSSALFPIEGGATYELNVLTPQGESVSSSCKVPASNINSASIELTDVENSTKVITVKWQDNPAETNYYVVHGEIETLEKIGEDTLIGNMNTDNYNTVNDSKSIGNELSMRLMAKQPTEKVVFTRYNAYLLNVDVNYYLLNKAVADYREGDPFSEPLPLYTNIKNGLGVFAAYQKIILRKQ